MEKTARRISDAADYGEFKEACTFRTIKEMYGVEETEGIRYVVFADGLTEEDVKERYPETAAVMGGFIVVAEELKRPVKCHENSEYRQMQKGELAMGEETLEEEATAGSFEDSVTDKVALGQALAVLKEEDEAGYTYVVMCSYEGETFAEAARRTGKSESWARKCNARGLERLRKLLTA